MNCKDVRENLIELLAETSPVAGHRADPAVTEHVRQCPACAQELESLRKTMSLLDEWKAPEPSPYFLTRLGAHVREEQSKAPERSSVFGWIRRPAMAVSLATVLLAGGLVYIGVKPRVEELPAPGTAVADMQALDKNHDVLVNTDLIDELSGGPSDDVTEE
jgi:anti-sigma factor RsiW